MSVHAAPARATRPVATPARDDRVPRPLRTVAVFTRAFSNDETPSGRHGVVRSVRAALAERGPVLDLRLRHLFERRRPRDWLGALGTALAALARGRPLPLQCLLFASRSERRRVAAAIRVDPPDVLYLDGVRTYLLLRDLRPHLNGTRVVVDMDDLMSRRMAALAARRLPLSLGYLGAQVPGPVRALAESRALAAALLRFEARALARVEAELAGLADALVFVSSADASELAAQLNGAADERVRTIPPPAEVAPRPEGLRAPVRFAFVGSDRQVQNRLTIDYLVDLWRRRAPRAELHVVGRQTRPPATVPGIVWRGFVPRLAQVYDDHTVLLAPALLPGGVKTKVIEALAHGCPVVGNALAFEGIGLSGYPLCLEDPALEALVADPEARLDTLRRAARMGHAFVARELSGARHRARWRAVLGPEASGFGDAACAIFPRSEPSLTRSDGGLKGS